MKIALHPRARTTPAIRTERQESKPGARALARQYGLARATVQKWRRRDTVADASHCPHTLHTTLTSAQEAIVVYLRQSLLRPLDDLLAVTREFLNPAVSRSGLDRCLRRHGVAKRQALRSAPETKPVKAFKAYEPGYVHIDVKYWPAVGGEPRQYLFVAIDRATRWVHVAIKKDRTGRSAKAFLNAVIQAAPFRVPKCLTDNGSEFTDRFLNRHRRPSGEHVFDHACADAGIEHRLCPPRHPQTNGMVERFNGRIAEVLQTYYFHDSDDLATTLLRYTGLYNHHLPQKALGHRTPIEALKQWPTSHPHLFRKQVYHLTGLDIYPASRS